MWILTAQRRGCRGHEEVLGVSWTGSNPTSHTALMTLCLIGSERKRRGASPSVREQPLTLCSVPSLCQEEAGIGRKRNQTKLPSQLHSDSEPPARHRGFQRNHPNAITSTFHYNKFSSACPSLSYYSKGDKKNEVPDFCSTCPSFRRMGGGGKQGVSATT